MMQDVLHDSPIYQAIIQEGVEKEHLQNLQKQRFLLLRFVQTRFPKLVDFATKQVSAVTDIDLLQDVTFHVGNSQTEEEAHQILTKVSKKHQK